MLRPDQIRCIGFDADDTLWVNEPIFVRTQEACKAIIRPYLDGNGGPNSFDERLYAHEMKNLRLFGYGIKGFLLSMIETVIELTAGRVAGRDIQRIIDLGKEMLEHPVQLLDHVGFAIDALENYYDLIVITKGDLFDQESKLARSGIGERFRGFEIVSEKDPVTYAAVLRRYGVRPEEFLMIGNSVKSDILPVLQLGGQAIHVPFHTTWQHEQVSEQQLEGHTYLRVENLREAVEWLLAGRPAI